MANRKISALDSVTVPASSDMFALVNEDITRKMNLRQLQRFMAMACRLATTGNIDLTTGGLLDIDGLTTVAGNRVLAWQQTNAAENGIYIVAEAGWARAENFNAAQNMVRGVLIPVLEGNTHTGAIFQHTTTQDITIETTNIVFARAAIPSWGAIQGDISTQTDLIDRINSDITTAVTDLREGVPADGDTLNKLYNLIQGVVGVSASAADIADRDTQMENLEDQQNIYVSDASGDPTVDSGWAIYKYIQATTSFVKIAEQESLDVSLGLGELSSLTDTDVMGAVDNSILQLNAETNLWEHRTSLTIPNDIIVQGGSITVQSGGVAVSSSLYVNGASAINNNLLIDGDLNVTNSISQDGTPLTDVFLQTGDNISELLNDTGYLTDTDLADYARTDQEETFTAVVNFESTVNINSGTISNTNGDISLQSLALNGDSRILANRNIYLDIDTNDNDSGVIGFRSKSSVSTLTEMDAYGNWNFQGNTLANIANPVNPQDAATMSYTDTAVAGLLEGAPDEGNTLNKLYNLQEALSDALGDKADNITHVYDMTVIVGPEEEETSPSNASLTVRAWLDGNSGRTGRIVIMPGVYEENEINQHEVDIWAVDGAIVWSGQASRSILSDRHIGADVILRVYGKGVFVHAAPSGSNDEQSINFRYPGADVYVQAKIIDMPQMWHNGFQKLTVEDCDFIFRNPGYNRPNIIIELNNCRFLNGIRTTEYSYGFSTLKIRNSEIILPKKIGQEGMEIRDKDNNLVLTLDHSWLLAQSVQNNTQFLLAFSGASGGGNINIEGIDYPVAFNTDIETTIEDFIGAYEASLQATTDSIRLYRPAVGTVSGTGGQGTLTIEGVDFNINFDSDESITTQQFVTLESSDLEAISVNCKAIDNQVVFTRTDGIRPVVSFGNVSGDLAVGLDNDYLLTESDEMVEFAAGFSNTAGDLAVQITDYYSLQDLANQIGGRGGYMGIYQGHFHFGEGRGHNLWLDNVLIRLQKRKSIGIKMLPTVEEVTGRYGGFHADGVYIRDETGTGETIAVVQGYDSNTITQPFNASINGLVHNCGDTMVRIEGLDDMTIESNDPIYDTTSVSVLANLEDDGVNIQNSPSGTGHFQWENVRLSGETLNNPNGGLRLDSQNTNILNLQTSNATFNTAPVYIETSLTLNEGNLLLGETGSNITNARLITQSTNPDVDITLESKGTGTVQVPTGYENNIASGEDLINRQYFEDNMVKNAYHFNFESALTQNYADFYTVAANTTFSETLVGVTLDGYEVSNDGGNAWTPQATIGDVNTYSEALTPGTYFHIRAGVSGVANSIGAIVLTAL